MNTMNTMNTKEEIDVWFDSSYPSFDLTERPKSLVKTQRCHQGHHYVHWNYDPHFLCINEPPQKLLFRSAVFSYPQDELLCYSPGKSVSPKLFCEKYNVHGPDIYVNEYIDGTMVNLFYDHRRDQWEIATKKSIGGKHHLYKNKKGRTLTAYTVREMFASALLRKGGDIHAHCLQCGFPKQYSYSFVLQYPDMDLLVPVSHPAIYLVAVYDIFPQRKRVAWIPPFVFESWEFLKFSTILFSPSKTFSHFTEISQATLFPDPPARGYHVVHCASGNRTIFECEHYKERVRLQSMNPQMLLQYLCLRRTQSISDFLEYCPQFRKYYKLFKDHFQYFVEHVHLAYMHKYVWKTAPVLRDVYERHAEILHRTIYIQNKHTKQTMTRKRVHDYMMSKPPAEILYYLCEENRRVVNGEN
jgi:hypothetical protein